eukprot:TRINITY_DN889_c0_g1_i7.p1 TRINITY_DN889_c0_g1~~TRINITY_DN889_c0_g1_i7.p1  ORF type:complete len:595 (+),score=183.09 TRINITY_DN889_c0_g1_i7:103-1887(+)
MATMRCAAGVALLAALVHAEVNLLCGLNSRCKSVEEARRVGFETLEYMKKHSPLEGMPDSNLKKVVERECARVSDKWPSEHTPSRRWVCLKHGRILAEDLMKHDTIKRGEKWSRKDTKELVPKIGTGVWFRVENGKMVKSMWYSRDRDMSVLKIPLQQTQMTLAYAAMFGAFDGLTFEFVTKDCDGCLCSPFEGHRNRQQEGFKHFPIAAYNKNRGVCDYIKAVPVQLWHHVWSPTRSYPDTPPAWDTLSNTAFFRGEIWNEMRAGLTAISALNLVPDTDMATAGCDRIHSYIQKWRRRRGPQWTRKLTKSHNEPKLSGSMCRPGRTEWVEQLKKYKYHVSADGISVAVRFWWTLKATGVLVSVESEHVDFYEDQIIPFVHFLSVPKNIHDMPESMREVMAWARKNDDITHQISKEGNLYFEEHASPEAQMLSISLYGALMAELWDDSFSNDPQYDLEKVTTPTKVYNHPEGLNCISGKDAVFPNWDIGGGCHDQKYPASLPAAMIERSVGTPRIALPRQNATTVTGSPCFELQSALLSDAHRAPPAKLSITHGLVAFLVGIAFQSLVRFEVPRRVAVLYIVLTFCASLLGPIV